MTTDAIRNISGLLQISLPAYSDHLGAFPERERRCAGAFLPWDASLPGYRSRHKPVCPKPSAKVNPQSKVVWTHPPPWASCAVVSITGVRHSRFSPRGSDVGKRVSSTYNGKEGPRSPHPPRGPLSTSAHRCATPLDVAVAGIAGDIQTPDSPKSSQFRSSDRTLSSEVHGSLHGSLAHLVHCSKCYGALSVHSLWQRGMQTE